MRPIGVGILGLGFIGQQHLQSYLSAANAGASLQLVALCDPDPVRRLLPKLSAEECTRVELGRPGLPEAPRAYAEASELFADPQIDLVSVCTYTESHVAFALEALAAGKHVVVEKPVALTPESVLQLADAARAHSGQLCMPAMCMRYWPGWADLATCVADGRYGAARAAHFRRAGPRPHWATAFYSDPARCGGAQVDLHIHDADFVRWCFGAPRAVSCAGSLDVLDTRYFFDAHSAPRAPVEVTAEAAWIDAPEASFQMSFEVEFEALTLRYDLAAPNPLSTLAHDGSAPKPLPLSSLSGYDGELRHALELVSRLLANAPGSAAPETTHNSGALLDDAVALASMLQREGQSLAAGGAVVEL